MWALWLLLICLNYQNNKSLQAIAGLIGTTATRMLCKIENVKGLWPEHVAHRTEHMTLV